MAVVDLSMIKIADTILRRNMKKDGVLKQKSFYYRKDVKNKVAALFSSGFGPTKRHYITKPYIAELRFRQMPEEEFNRKIAKLEMFNINTLAEIAEHNEEGYNIKEYIKPSEYNVYNMRDFDNKEDVLIEIEEKPAFTAEDWKIYRKYKDDFKKELSTCLYEVTTDEIVDRVYSVEEKEEDRETWFTDELKNKLIDMPDKNICELPEEIPIRYTVTLSSKTPISFRNQMFMINKTLFTYVDMGNTHMYNDFVPWIISANPMLKVIDISEMNIEPILKGDKIFQYNDRLHTIIGLSKLKYSDKVRSKEEKEKYEEIMQVRMML